MTAKVICLAFAAHGHVGPEKTSVVRGRRHSLRGGTTIEVSKSALEARRAATALPSARKINVCLRECRKRAFSVSHRGIVRRSRTTERHTTPPQTEAQSCRPPAGAAAEDVARAQVSQETSVHVPSALTREMFHPDRRPRE